MSQLATSNEARDSRKTESVVAIGCADLFGEPLPNSHNRIVMASSEDMTWPTPQPIFDALNAEFKFTLDPCCVPATAKCAKYYTPKEDGLKQDWSGERAFVNPPYGKWLKPWMKKSYEESLRGALVVCLVPARVDTAWWHDYAAKGEVRFPRGRIKNKNGVYWPFAAAIVVFKPRQDVKMINGRAAIACPNPDCDPEGGCCICEHTGWVDANSQIFKNEI